MRSALVKGTKDASCMGAGEGIALMNMLRISMFKTFELFKVDE